MKKTTQWSSLVIGKNMIQINFIAILHRILFIGVKSYANLNFSRMCCLLIDLSRFFSLYCMEASE